MSILKIDDTVEAELPYELELTLQNTNPSSQALYVEAYQYVSKRPLFGTLINNLSSKMDVLDPTNIGIYFNTIYREVLREIITKNGITIDNTIDLSTSLSIVELLAEIDMSTNLTDVLNSVTSDVCTIEYICNLLGLEFTIDISDSIISSDIYITNLYTRELTGV